MTLDSRRSLSEGGAVGTSGWSKTNRSAPKVNPTTEDWGAAGESQSKAEWHSNVEVHPGQFQMFMTPREIRGKYEALGGDREQVGSERAGELTARPETTEGQPNITINTAERSRLARWHGGTDQVEQYTHRRHEDYGPENDDQLFARKLEESQMSPGEYRELHGGTPNELPGWETLGARASAPSGVRAQAAGEYSRPPGMGSGTWQEREDEAFNYVDEKQWQFAQDDDYGPSLHERISEEGVLSPVHLSYDQMGSHLGRNQIVGGHHRLAVAEDLDPDQPIPVRHWANFPEARSSGDYT